MSLIHSIKRKVGRMLRGPEEDWRRQVPSPILRRIPPQAGPITVVDIGAHMGDYTRALSLQYRIRRGVLIEPIPSLAAALRPEFAAPVYTVLECAVSDREGMVSFQKYETPETSSLLKIKRDHAALAGVPLEANETLEVRTRTLDNVISEAGLDEIDLLKIDVQGAEDRVIAGAAQSLGRIRAITVEVSFKPLYEGSATFPEIYATLDRDFRLADIIPAFRSPDGELMQADLFFLRR